MEKIPRYMQLAALTETAIEVHSQMNTCSTTSKERTLWDHGLCPLF